MSSVYSFFLFFFFSFKNLKSSETNELIYKTETDSQTQNEFMVGDGGREEWGKESGSLGPPDEHRELCSMWCGPWIGREFGREWIHVYVWLSSFTVHLKLSALLIGYVPIQKKVFCGFFFFFKNLIIITDPIVLKKKAQTCFLEIHTYFGGSVTPKNCCLKKNHSSLETGPPGTLFDEVWLRTWTWHSASGQPRLLWTNKGALNHGRSIASFRHLEF